MKIIKLTEQEFKNIINKVINEQGNYDVTEDPKALALVNFLNDTETDRDYGLIDIKLNDIDAFYGNTLYIVGDREYGVYTDEEANRIASERIEESVWAFDTDFIIQRSLALGKTSGDSAEKILGCIREYSEDGNEVILRLIDNIGSFIKDAIISDGRAHFISTYDDEENISGDYNIYRLN